MKKRIAALIALIMVVCIIAAACGTKDEPGESASPTESPSTATEEPDDETGDGRKMEGNMYLEGMPIVEKTETFTFLIDDAGAAEDKYMIPVLEEQTNVKVEWIIYPYEIAQEKKNILINSGDYPDVLGDMSFYPFE
jgi:putative aldouronate transport system substrate-binding protein